jgi:hypothetical protein
MNEYLAAIDIGTNSIHLVVVKANENNRFEIIAQEKEVVRLGSGSKDMKYLKEDAMDRGIEVLKRYKQIADISRAEVKAVATSAVREALNQEVFIQRARAEAGIEVEIISGFEEARLIYLGVLQALPIFDKKILLIDIGGGSTEFLIGKAGEMIEANSLKLGAIRLTDQFFKEDPLEVFRSRAAPRSIVVWPSCPQACIRPSFWDLCSKAFLSCIGRQSMSARSPMARPLPFFLPGMTPTTPVLAMPRCTSMPQLASLSATRLEVRSSWNESSGCAWMSRRTRVSSPW